MAPWKLSSRAVISPFSRRPRLSCRTHRENRGSATMAATPQPSNQEPIPPTTLSPARKRRIEKALSAALSPSDEAGSSKLCGAEPLISPDEDGDGEMWITEVEALGIEVPTARAAGQACPEPKCKDGCLELRRNSRTGESFGDAANTPSVITPKN